LRTLAFLNHWLRGTPDPSPGFTWYQDWVPYKGSGPSNSYGSAPAFPAGSPLTWTLSGTDGLVSRGATAGTVSIVNPAGGVPSSYTETSNFTGPDSSPNLAQAPTDVPGEFAAFTAPRFLRTTDVVGVPTLRVKLSHVAPTDLVVFGKVFDVGPDGTAVLIHRLIAPARIPSTALSSPVTLKLLGFAHRFAAGHSLRLVLASTDLTSYNNKVADVITVTTGAGNTLTVNTLAQSRPVVVPKTPPRRSGSQGLASTGLNIGLPIAALVLIGGALWIRRRR